MEKIEETSSRNKSKTEFRDYEKLKIDYCVTGFSLPNKGRLKTSLDIKSPHVG